MRIGPLKKSKPTKIDLMELQNSIDTLSDILTSKRLQSLDILKTRADYYLRYVIYAKGRF